MTDHARSKIYPDNSRAAQAELIAPQAELIARPATAPAYFLGLPATAWLAIFRPKLNGKNG
jgi:hypothetical protein